MAVLKRLFGLDRSTQKTRESLVHRIRNVFQQAAVIDDDLWEEAEAILLQADVGVPTTEELLRRLREAVRLGEARTGEELFEILKEEMEAVLVEGVDFERPLLRSGALNAVLVVGVNGVGKTTTIAKLGAYWRDQGHRVLLAAGDTFRAAAIDQLKVWGERAGLPVVAHQPGADAGSVVYDALAAARARGADVVLIDTAGRLHTKYNLMEELKKVRRVIEKQGVEAITTLLVVDATTGQNAINQVKQFREAVGLDGLIVTKLDGTAKGGVVFAIVHELKVPVRFLGTGEKLDDLAEFWPMDFVDALFGEEKRGRG
ncbi:MAG TPA: signal recognition particle-docking protein FtsY [Chloroflexota bacterium]|jgi:fused signal recognition particle receptor|nr:signal recognition particle-docking protein FtsY [Chloroflexota bacterium]